MFGDFAAFGAGCACWMCSTRAPGWAPHQLSLPALQATRTGSRSSDMNGWVVWIRGGRPSLTDATAEVDQPHCLPALKGRMRNGFQAGIGSGLYSRPTSRFSLNYQWKFAEMSRQSQCSAKKHLGRRREDLKDTSTPRGGHKKRH